MLELNPSKTRPSALQHGAWAETAILPGEDPRQFERLHRGLIKEWSPCGPAEQDAVAAILLEELASEQRWAESFAKSQDVLEKLAGEALAEHRAGLTKLF